MLGGGVTMASSQANVLRLPPPEVLESLPEKQRELIVEAAAFSGPLPPPSMYRNYEAILPGSAERILRWAELAQERQFGLETNALKRSFQRQRLALLVGFALALAVLASAMFLALTGHADSAAVIATSSSLAAPATVLSEAVMRKRRSRGARPSEPPVP